MNPWLYNHLMRRSARDQWMRPDGVLIHPMVITTTFIGTDGSIVEIERISAHRDYVTRRVIAASGPPTPNGAVLSHGITVHSSDIAEQAGSNGEFKYLVSFAVVAPAPPERIRRIWADAEEITDAAPVPVLTKDGMSLYKFENFDIGRFGKLPTMRFEDLPD